MINKKKFENFLITTLLIVHIISWVLFMPIAQIQMMTFGKRLFSFLHYGIIEIVIIIMLIVLKKGKLKINKFNKTSVLFIIFTSISWLFNMFSQSNMNSFVALFYLMYWIIPFIIIIIVNNYEYDIKKILYFLLLIIIIHSLIIVYQKFSNTMFWQYTTYDDGTKIFEMDTYYNAKNMLRCSGLCVTGLDAGILLIFGLILTTVLEKLNKTSKLILRVLFIVSILFTGTRNIYVMLFYIIIVSILMKTNIPYKRKNKLLISFTLISCICYFYYAISMSSFNTTGDILTDTTSIGIRLNKWDYIINKIYNGGIGNLLFGVMKWQNAGNSEIMDNLFLEVTYCSGLFSLLLYIKNIISISSFEGKVKDFKAFLCSGFTLCYFVYGIMNSSSNFFYTLILILYLYCSNKNNFLYNNNSNDRRK